MTMDEDFAILTAAAAMDYAERAADNDADAYGADDLSDIY